MAKYWNALRRGAVLGLLAGTTTLAAGCAVSQQQELEMGAQYAAQINQQLPIVDDANLNRYINVLGRQIAARGARGLQYQFFIVNSNVVNAFAVPGGYVYINRGIIERADNVSELAGVLAHEIAHVEHRHGVEQMEKAQSANLGLTLAYVLLGRAPTGVEEAAINIGGGLYFARHSREAENEADRTAVPLMVAAGISPVGLPTFFEELIAERQRSPNALESWFATHPLTEDRIANTRALVNQYSAAQLRNLTLNTPQFTDFKARMRRYAAPPPEPRR
ncbi:MAG TPA: M48 family metallopeptidase [Longimicrobiales bacterium]|nr:M48 family metallopeptidase [Longimicrobiales bacterium]